MSLIGGTGEATAGAASTGETFLSGLGRGSRFANWAAKDHSLVDTKARPIQVALTAGQRHEMIAAEELLDHARGRALIGDTGYDSNDFRREIRARELKAVIHSKPERRRALPLDRAHYPKRYLVVFFDNLKHFRAVATRYEKTARNYLALVQVACAWLWLR